MSFKVEPEVLKAIAGRYEASAERLAAARDYNLAYSELEWHEAGLIVGLKQPIAEHDWAVRGVLHTAAAVAIVVPPRAGGRKIGPRQRGRSGSVRNPTTTGSCRWKSRTTASGCGGMGRCRGL